ncbi:SPOR domain-containing protein [Duganella sp. LX20W]|uniref:SPOR domain-containing protein n=1 Tax=Rugamonas brunnea TaxID=2758569 RepID=A0A7W2EPI5_9BURK|nr:SPOR domain-containing protein [Rugamonas brunnea]MBA5636201.1 SPOR domain-containing protein [Rugamonas brunnea]
MLKFIFWSLLAVNGALFAYGQGYLGHFSGNEREPARLKNQLNADKLAVIPAEKAAAAASASANASASAAAKAGPQALACVEVGNFVLAEARRFEKLVEPLDLGDRQSRRNLPGTEASSYIVFIPPQGSKEAADKKAGELRALGVTNYFVMSDSQTMRWAISLGVFKTEGAAQNQLAALVKQGVHSARVAPRMSGGKLLVFQFRDIDTDIKARIDDLRSGFPNTETRSCK